MTNQIKEMKRRFEEKLAEDVRDILKQNNLLHSSLHGFQSRRSIDTNLHESYDHITMLLDTGVPADMLLPDFFIGFDKVCNKQLTVEPKVKSLLWILDLQSLFFI
jgi:hypothetical protein